MYLVPTTLSRNIKNCKYQPRLVLAHWPTPHRTQSSEAEAEDGEGGGFGDVIVKLKRVRIIDSAQDPRLHLGNLGQNTWMQTPCQIVTLDPQEKT